MLGAMAMPAAFKYKDVFLKGKPQHTLWDDFTSKHPPMPPTRWAKIFSPFDALKGFDEAISSKEEIFERRHELGEDEKRQLNRLLSILHNYTYNSRMARTNRVMVTVTNFEPKDPDDDFGRYIDTAGMVLNVDEVKETMTLETEDGKAIIDFEDILEVKAEKKNLFDEEWDEI